MAWLHHLFLHFPLTLAPLAFLLLFYGRIRHDEPASKVGRLLTYLATLSALLAIATGLASAGHFVEGGGDAGTVELHRNLAIGAAAALLLASAWLLRGRAQPGTLARFALVMLATSTALVLAAGHFGGEMLHPGMLPWSGHAHMHGPRPTQPAPSVDDTAHGAHEGMLPAPAAPSTPVPPAAPPASPTIDDRPREGTKDGDDGGAAASGNVAPAPAPTRPRPRNTLPATGNSVPTKSQTPTQSQAPAQAPRPAPTPPPPPAAPMPHPAGHTGH